MQQTLVHPKLLLKLLFHCYLSLLYDGGSLPSFAVNWAVANAAFLRSTIWPVGHRLGQIVSAKCTLWFGQLGEDSQGVGYACRGIVPYTYDVGAHALLKGSWKAGLGAPTLFVQ